MITMNLCCMAILVPGVRFSLIDSSGRLQSFHPSRYYSNNFLRCYSAFSIKRLRTYGCKDGRCEENGLDVAPLIDRLLVGQIDALSGRHRNSFFVLQKFLRTKQSMHVSH